MKVNINDLVVLNKTDNAILWRVCEIDGHGVGLIDAAFERVQPNQQIQWIDKCYLHKPTKAQRNFKHHKPTKAQLNFKQ